MNSRAGISVPEWITILVIAGLVAYLPAVWGVFTFDDYPWILRNAGLDPRSFDFSLRRPVTLITFAANLQAGGPDPVGFHVVNIALHLANGVLVYLVLVRSLPRTPDVAALAALGAAIFLLHPAQTGAVAYVSGRATSLMTFWLLVAHLAALRSRESRSRASMALSLVAFALAVGSKETALVWPALWMAWLVFGEGVGFTRALRIAVPPLAAALVMVAGMLLHPGYRNLLNEGLEAPQLAATPVGRIEQRLGLGFCFNQEQARDDSCIARRVESLSGLGRYLLSPRDISIDPGRRPIGAADWLAVAMAACAAWAALRTRPSAIAAGAAWIVVSLLPTSLLAVRPDPVSDRLLYLPMVGIALVAAALPARLGTPMARRLAAACGATIVLALAALAWERNLQYTSEVALWADAVAKNPRNARAHVNLAYALENEGRFDRAGNEYRAALELRPGLLWARRGLERIGAKRDGET